ncbi:DUF2948 family protein [Parvularcula lutaonensis]|uniref:DUF2948 family protein n=1 Tax=Parvularcula lutaonensis TaxID=491923 RepID=A0ABV7MFZ3_9PROT|nr:DUF2948 family protein [Parvularcula lutaonensis]GGY54660.1 hypothetical protein GCM10007148_25440 [Parvularcula lutaonensis]
MAAYKPLALMAADAEDLKAVSALLQDAIVKLGDTAYLPDERRFVFMANRYVWEKKPGFLSPGLRVRTGVHFDDVTAVKARGVRMEAKEAFIDILCTDYDGDENGGTITLNLAGGGTIALDVEAINVNVKDVSPPWRAARRPKHETA